MLGVPQENLRILEPTLPKTNSSPLKMDGFQVRHLPFSRGPPIFRGV